MKTPGNLPKFHQYAYPMQTILLTSNDSKGNTNIMTIAWHMPISSNPPLYGVSIAPKRYTHMLIESTKEFALNFVPYEYTYHAHFCGTHTGRTTNKQKETKLTFIPAQKISVPLIKECYAHLECTLKEQYTIGDHTLFIGEIVAVKKDDTAFSKDILNLKNINPACYIGANTYTTLSTTQQHTY
jgi:flavin reductase (DIM6/NTAB) family NADH-FMN oxidoreductase RutF